MSRCGAGDDAHAAGRRFAHRARSTLKASDADSAVKAAWAAYSPDAKWPLKVDQRLPDKDGWTNIRNYNYQTSPNEKRDVGASVASARTTSGRSSIYDMAQAVGEKRGGQVALIFGRLLPEGLRARDRSPARRRTSSTRRGVAALATFIETGCRSSRVPGVALGIVQDGKVVFADGFGVRELGKPAKPDGDTLFMIASNTKALTTLMLAKLVDEGKLDVGHAGDDAAAVVQARRRRHHEPGAREAPDLRVHRLAAAGLRVAASSTRASPRKTR